MSNFNLDDIPRKNLRKSQALADKFDCDKLTRSNPCCVGLAHWTLAACGMDCQSLPGSARALQDNPDPIKVAPDIFGEDSFHSEEDLQEEQRDIVVEQARFVVEEDGVDIDFGSAPEMSPSPTRENSGNTSMLIRGM